MATSFAFDLPEIHTVYCICNEDKCNNKETEATKKTVESKLTFEKAMARMSNDPDTMEDLLKKKTGSTESTGSRESLRGSGI